MLNHLKISNYALIKEVELDFKPGLTAITGETGSGKSILLGAFGLLLGERADSKSIRDENQKCIVEAVFDLKGYGLDSFFESNDLDFDELTTVRREIAPGGKSRAFINDTPVQIAVLKQLGTMLVDVHSQHENSLLGSREFQFDAVDSFAANHQLRAEYTLAYIRYKSISKELDDLLTNQEKIRSEMDFIQFQLAEFEKADLANTDIPALEQELETLNNAEQIKSVLQEVSLLIDGENNGVISQLVHSKNLLGKIIGFNTELESYHRRLESCSIELRELVREMEHFDLSISLDQKRIDVINEKLSQVYHLQRKHRLQTAGELIAFYEELSQKSGSFVNFDDKVEQLQKELAQLETTLSELAAALTASRKKAAEKVEEEVKYFFKSLSLDHARLSVELTASSSYNSFGNDEIQFLFSANKGSRLQPVKQVASGGEISRVMLALKAAISKYKKLPVLILDEIDQGVSGEVGNKIGQILKEMSHEIQLLTITHLPQIAGKAANHYKVYKFIDGQETNTGVVRIDGEERVNELAEMLSGKDLTKAAIENAREMMSR